MTSHSLQEVMSRTDNARVFATTPDPEYSDDLINVEVYFDGQVEMFDDAPIICLNQVNRDIPGQTILLESKDLYLSLSNFGKLIFTAVELFSVLSKQYVDVATMDSDHKQETIDNCNRVIKQLQSYVTSLEGTNETN
jgi:hypothetical protein